ncbi:S-4TM family putative pore-forming effector [Streptomyces rugosispiralis]|uniref:S-4TM family putative pore-forming effector n=1 Tax=Streptomyces rugosispiralis TaxID=2967341 RepID=A0ABT1UYF1_9ACTN|nr:S-4TM family putative pore-forming effector [Streptomyces rugosispiralis]MCQ8190152.1 S-4TM family putative pore-forming effector [Streptomyces rugosispiralis]
MNLSSDPGGVHGIPLRAIHERQLDDDMLLLQRAAAASHQRGQFLEAVRVTAAVALAAAGVLITLIGHGRTAVSIVGFFWFVVSAFLLKGLAGNTARQGALLQEMFDIVLFHLPWRATVAGDPIPEPDVRRLARKLPRGSAKDKRITDGWYDPTNDVHHPYDVFIAQEQNLSWDARLRRRYSHLIAATAILWTTIGLVAGLVVADATLGDTLLSFFVPSLAAYQIAYEIWSGQRKVADERDRLTKVVNTELHNGRPGPVPDDEWHRLRNVARDVQDSVLRTRLDTTRVPEWFYTRFRDDDERDFGDTAEGHRFRLAQNTPPPT